MEPVEIIRLKTMKISLCEGETQSRVDGAGWACGKMALTFVQRNSVSPCVSLGTPRAWPEFLEFPRTTAVRAQADCHWKAQSCAQLGRVGPRSCQGRAGAAPQFNAVLRKAQRRSSVALASMREGDPHPQTT